MKKNLTIIAALFAIAAVSCEKEKTIPEKENVEDKQTVETVSSGDGVVLLSASLPEAPDSRSVLGAKDGSVYHPLWTATDSIIVNGVVSAEAQLSNGGLNATFAVEGVSAPYVVLAPASQIRSANYSYYDGEKKYDYVFPGAGKPQNYTVDGEGNPTYDPRVGFLAAYSEDENLSFKHLNVYFRITATTGTDSDNIRYVYIRNGDGSNTAGTWTASYTDADHISIEPTSLTSVITLDCGEGGVPQGTPMIVALPAYNYSTGLIVTIKDINGHFISFKIKSSATDFSATAGTVYEFERVFSPESGTINSAEDWEAFAAALNSGKDHEIYRWVGNGAVKIGSDISAETLTRITSFSYNLDGQNHIITRTGATTNLFTRVYGSVNNLTLAGTLTASSQTAPLAFSVEDGGSISNCTNNMSIVFNGANHGYVGGIVLFMYGGTITGCTNNGSIDVTVDNSTANHNINVGGIVAQANPDASVVLENCTNNGDITITPISAADDSYGSVVNGAGGIVGWLRGTTYSFTLRNCDNHGDISYSAAGINSTVGFKKYSACLGGIVGIGSGISASNGALSTPNGTNGIKVSLYDCDNDGALSNCYVINSNGSALNTKVFTGGIAGSLMGNSEDYIELDKCTNTGNILTYNITGSGAATTPGYAQVAGGLVGFGGYLEVSNESRSVCTIGDRKRPAFAYAGAIGVALRPFTIDNSTIWVELNMVRLNASNCNNGLIAAVPTKFSSNLSPAPDFDDDSSTTGPNDNFSSIKITNSTLGGKMSYTDLSAGNYEDTSDKSTASSSDMAFGETRMIRGNCNPSSITTTPATVTKSGNTFISVAP